MTKTEAASIRAGVRPVLERKAAAFDDFTSQVADVIGATKASKVAAFYSKNKLIKYDGLRFTVKHGAYWERDVLLRAFDMATGA